MSQPHSYIYIPCDREIIITKQDSTSSNSIEQNALLFEQHLNATFINHLN